MAGEACPIRRLMVKGDQLRNVGVPEPMQGAVNRESVHHRGEILAEAVRIAELAIPAGKYGAIVWCAPHAQS